MSPFGFIILHRAAFEHPLLKDGDRFRAFLWMCASACWKPTRFDLGGKTVTLERGQLCVSRSQLAKEWGWSESAVERFLTRLKTEQMIERETGQGKSIITICNYEKYQDISDQAGQQTGQRSDSHRTAKEPYNHLTKEKEGESPPPDTPKINEVDALVATWNEICDIANLRRCVSVDDTRRRKAALRIKELGLEEMQECCARAGLSKFLTGHNDRNYRAGIEVILEPSKLTKLREGMYDDDAPRSRPPPEPRQRSGLRTNALIDQVTKGLRA